MPLSLLIILLGIICALLVHQLIGIVLVIVGVFLLIAPSVRQ